MDLPPEIITDVMSNHLNLREVTLLARQDRQYQRGLDYLRNQAIRQVAAEHQVKTLIGIFKTYATQPDKYHLALQAYKELLRIGPVTAKTFLYPHLLLQIGLDIADASVVSKAISSLNLNVHSRLLYQVYLLSTRDEFFRKRLIELLPERNGLVFFRQAIRPDSGIGRFLATRDLNQIRGYTIGSALYQFFIDFEQDWVWEMLPPGSFKWDTSEPFGSDLLTGRYLTDDITKAAILANLGVLNNETYLLLVLQTTTLPWYQDANVLANLQANRRGLNLATLIEYGLAKGWHIVTLLRSIFAEPTSRAAILQTRLMPLTNLVFEALPSFLAGDSNQLILALSDELNPQALVRLINLGQPERPNPLRLALLKFLAVGLRYRLRNPGNLIDLTVELAELVLTEDDLAAILAANMAAELNPGQFTDMADLLPWYRQVADTSQLTNFINQYLRNEALNGSVNAAVNAAVNDFGFNGFGMVSINPVVFLIGHQYGFQWPSDFLVQSFSSQAMAAYCARKFYGKVNLTQLSQVVHGEDRFGGIESAVLRSRYNLVEI